MLSPKKEQHIWTPHDLSRTGIRRDEGIDTPLSLAHHPPSPSPSPNRYLEQEQHQQQLRHQQHQQLQEHHQQQQQRRQLHQQDGHKKFKRDLFKFEDKQQQQQQQQHQQHHHHQHQPQHPQQHHQQQQQREDDEPEDMRQRHDSEPVNAPSIRGSRARGRGRRGRHRGDRIGSRSMSEMSVRGLDLLRYATLAPDGTYRCIECERVQISKHFKNKYSFQRHAFLYHEGAARKVFPCVICQKEFSRPDKMKQHLKQAHDCNAGGSPGKSSSPSAAAMASAISAAMAAGMASPTMTPSALLVNPFLGLSDPTSTEGKIGSLKDSGARC